MLLLGVASDFDFGLKLCIYIQVNIIEISFTYFVCYGDRKFTSIVQINIMPNNKI